MTAVRLLLEENERLRADNRRMAEALEAVLDADKWNHGYRPAHDGYWELGLSSELQDRIENAIACRRQGDSDG